MSYENADEFDRTGTDTNGSSHEQQLWRGYHRRMKVLWAIYLAGALLALWRTDAAWPTKIALAVLWPLGPLAFVITVGILLAASLVGFPLIAGGLALGGAVALWWLLR